MQKTNTSNYASLYIVFSKMSRATAKNFAFLLKNGHLSHHIKRAKKLFCYNCTTEMHTRMNKISFFENYFPKKNFCQLLLLYFLQFQKPKIAKFRGLVQENSLSLTERDKQNFTYIILPFTECYHFYGNLMLSTFYIFSRISKTTRGNICKITKFQ